MNGEGVKERVLSEMENGGKAPSIAEGIEQLCLGEELTAVVASRLGWFSLSITSFWRWWERLFEFDIRCYDKDGDQY